MSNTEQMVSVPRGWLYRINPSPCNSDWQFTNSDEHAARLSKSLNVEVVSLPAAHPQQAPLGWVYEGGQEFTSDPNLAHDLRAEGIELTAVYGHAQHQGEPVALPARKDEMTADWKADLGAQKWNSCLDEIAKLGPLYTHPDAGEVERLRAQVAKQACVFCNDSGNLMAENEKLRTQLAECEKHRKRLLDNNVERVDEVASYQAQLAERDALLRDINKRHSSGVDFDLPADLAARVTALSASAEPKSCGACAGCTNGCQLEKDSPPSAQVERDELRGLLLSMTCSYRSAIQAGFDRITALGGNCDSVDKMLADFPDYAKARAALERNP